MKNKLHVLSLGTFFLKEINLSIQIRNTFDKTQIKSAKHFRG